MSDERRHAIIRRIGDLTARADANSEPQCGRVVFLGRAQADALFDGEPPIGGRYIFGCEVRVDTNLDGIVLEVPPPPQPSPKRYT